jgi:catechol 2,3-dioxygenase-like lactoylglutathione lyase family enzyme
MTGLEKSLSSVLCLDFRTQLVNSSPVKKRFPRWIYLVFAAGVSLFVAGGRPTAFEALQATAATGSGAVARASRPPIVGIANVRLRSSDLAAATKFYTGFLGYELAFHVADAASKKPVAYFKVNDHQYIEVAQDLTGETEDRFEHVAFETTDARKLRDYLASQGVEVPARIGPGGDGSLSFQVTDPDGHRVEFVQYRPGSLEARNFGKDLPETRISGRIIHAGFMVKDRAAADKFYNDILQFRMIWYGGRKDSETDYVDMAVPEGKDWLEYMLNAQNPSPKALASLNHFSLGVPDVESALATLRKRDPSLKAEPHVGRNGKPQTNLYAPSLTRVELMGPKPVRTPCCSPLLE